MKSLTRNALGLLILPLFGCGGKPVEPPLAGTDPDLNGIWIATRMEEGGKPLSTTEMKKLITTYQFQNGTLNVTNSRNDPQTQTYAVDSTVNPKRISFDVKGVKTKDIYEISGKDLKICMSVDGKNYPTEFVSKPGLTDLVVFVRK